MVSFLGWFPKEINWPAVGFKIARLQVRELLTNEEVNGLERRFTTKSRFIVLASSIYKRLNPHGGDSRISFFFFPVDWKSLRAGWGTIAPQPTQTHVVVRC